MIISDFNSLVGQIKNWSHRANLDAQIPLFIENAERAMNRILYTRNMEQRATHPVERYIPLPPDYVELRSIRVTPVCQKGLEFASQSEIDRLYGDRKGDPIVYCIVGNQFLIAPDPSNVQSGIVEIDYLRQIPNLSTSAPSNWFLVAHADLYLWAALSQLAIYTKNSDDYAMYNAKMMQGFDDIESADHRARWSGPPMAVKPDVRIY